MPSVPSLFWLTPTNAGRRREPIHTEIPAQWRDRRYRDRRQKFEFHYDVWRAFRRTASRVQQQSAATPSSSSDPNRPAKTSDLRQRLSTTAMRLVHTEAVSLLATAVRGQENRDDLMPVRSPALLQGVAAGCLVRAAGRARWARHLSAGLPGAAVRTFSTFFKAARRAARAPRVTATARTRSLPPALPLAAGARSMKPDVAGAGHRGQVPRGHRLSVLVAAGRSARGTAHGGLVWVNCSGDKIRSAKKPVVLARFTRNPAGTKPGLL